MTAIILAGGKSSRLGRNKGVQALGRKTLIQWIVDRLATISTEIIIATARGEPMLPSPSPMVRTVADVYPGKGPLAGMHSGLGASSNPRAFVVACDTPFLSPDLLQYMAQAYSTADVVVPRLGSSLEPLFGVYSTTCLAPIQKLLEQDKRRIYELFGMVTVRYVEQAEIDRFDPEHLSFFNINSEQDLDKARKLAIEKGWLA